MPEPILPSDYIKTNEALKKAKIVIDEPIKEFTFVHSVKAPPGKKSFTDVFKVIDGRRIGEYTKAFIQFRSSELADSKRGKLLAELACKTTNWTGIVDAINSAIEKADITDRKSESEGAGDGSLLKPKFISNDNIKIIEILLLETIRRELREEVHEKMALLLNTKLEAAVTWVAMVICWYKLHRDLETKFKQRLKGFEYIKESTRKNFIAIARGDAAGASAYTAEEF